jgi:hypothetical protein
MRIGGFGTYIPLSEFAGCYLKLVTAEHEDCRLAVTIVADEVRTWLNDTVNGNNPWRTVEIFQYGFGGTASQTTLESAFISEFTLSAMNPADSKSPVTISMVLVPQSIATTSGGPNFTVATQPIAGAAMFLLEIDSVDGSRMRSVSSLRMRVQKVLDTANTTGIAAFIPGQMSFDDITLTAATAGGQTVADLEAWVANIAAGIFDARDGNLDLLRFNLTFVTRVELSNLEPIEMLPFAVDGESGSKTSVGVRSVKLRVGSFRFQ